MFSLFSLLFCQNKPGIKQIDNCIKLCKTNEKCYYWTFKGETKECTLFSMVNNVIKNNNSTKLSSGATLPECSSKICFCTLFNNGQIRKKYMALYFCLFY